MSKITALLASALVVGAPLTLTACETETQTEIESDGDVDRDVEIGLDDAAVDEAQDDLQNLGAEVEDGARQVGNDIEAGAQNAADAIDDNIDIGDNAGTPEVDDNN